MVADMHLIFDRFYVFTFKIIFIINNWIEKTSHNTLLKIIININ